MERMDLRKLRAIQLKRLRRLLAFAFQECRFYRRLFRTVGVLPEEIRSFDDFWRKVPVVKKHDLVEEIKRTGDYTAGIYPVSKLGRLRNVSLTSGTTATNTFIAATDSFTERFARVYLSREMWMEGLRPGMRVLMQVSGWHFFGLGMNRLMRRWGNDVITPRGTQTYKFSREHLELLLNRRPEYFITTPSMLSSVIDECDAARMEPEKVFESVRFVHVAGEGLTPGARKRLIERTGVEDVFESGGSVDGIWGGGECSLHQGHHVWMDQGYLEVVDPRTGEALGPGQARGAAVNTHFSLDASVFIRFNSQDFVTLTDEECACGRTHNRVEIHDRLSNLVEVGRRQVSPHEIAICLEGIPETASALFVVVRDARKTDVLNLRLARTRAVSDPRKTARKVSDALRETLGIDSVVSWVDADSLRFVHGKLVRVIDENLADIGEGRTMS